MNMDSKEGQDLQEQGQGEDLVVVYHAPDEYAANVVKGLLEGEDVPVTVESFQLAWLDGVMTMGEGYWGKVVVPQEFLEKSKELILAYEAQAEVTNEDVGPEVEPE